MWTTTTTVCGVDNGAGSAAPPPDLRLRSHLITHMAKLDAAAHTAVATICARTADQNIGGSHGTPPNLP
jgi:hypothetical protein